MNVSLENPKLLLRKQLNMAKHHKKQSVIYERCKEKHIQLITNINHRGKGHFSKDRNPRDSANLIVNCTFCGGQHTRGKCPAYNKRCNNCLQLNHFAKCCNIKNTRKVREIYAEASDKDELIIVVRNQTKR